MKVAFSEIKIGVTYRYSDMNPDNPVHWLDMFTIGTGGKKRGSQDTRGYEVFQ